ncbi:hypothetical protein KC325_g319, partial [Hortaea werneckii]
MREAFWEANVEVSSTRNIQLNTFFTTLPMARKSLVIFPPSSFSSSSLVVCEGVISVITSFSTLDFPVTSHHLTRPNRSNVAPTLLNPRSSRRRAKWARAIISLASIKSGVEVPSNYYVEPHFTIGKLVAALSRCDRVKSHSNPTAQGRERRRQEIEQRCATINHCAKPDSSKFLQIPENPRKLRPRHAKESNRISFPPP